MMLGFALLFALDWLPVAVIPAQLILHFGITLPEERYLEGRFGVDYRRYKAAVPRYFGPI